MSAWLWIAVPLALLALVAILSQVMHHLSGTPRDGEVLPSHYSSLLQFQRDRYPGHCPACGTDNEPGYDYCETCGSRIPTTGRPNPDANVRAIFRD